MANDNRPIGPSGTITPATIALAMFNAAIGSQISLMLGVQRPATELDATDIMNVLVEHLANLLSQVEPEQARNAIIGEVRRNLAMVVNRHLEARMTTKGGVFVPGTRVQ